MNYDDRKPVDLEPGWYRVRWREQVLFREKRKGESMMFNQRGYKQFYVSEYEILERVHFIPMREGVRYV